MAWPKKNVMENVGSGPMQFPEKPAKILPLKPKKRAAKVPKPMHQQIAERMIGG
ncbi:MAG TPA: hypothetical protein VKX49_26260 [Bryobacteraceae bacterium]|nr:hypothetical protein [Bryobacteraceae bacterium]